MKTPSKKGILLFFLLLGVTVLFGVSFPQQAAASPLPDSIMEEQLSRFGTDDITNYWEKITSEYGGYLPETQKGSLLEFIKGEKTFSLKEWGKGIVKYVFFEVFAQGKLLGTLILLTVFSMLLQTIQSAFEKSTVSKVAYAIVYMVLIVLALNSFRLGMTYAKDAIEMMMDFMTALLPLVLALMATLGGMMSVAFFHPIVVFLVNSSGLLINKFVLPLLFFSALLSIVSTMSEQLKVTQLATLLRNVAMGALALFFTVFISVISVQGATTAVSDGITMKTAKFVTGNFIPVVGRMFTEATETVMSASLLLKNTVGIAGVVMLLLLAIFPAVKVLVLGFIYTFAAAILQPLGGGPIIDCLQIIGKSVFYVFAALATVSIMFFLAITIIVAAGNLSLMVR
ncbi:stage III sporulation protein AE [Fictibacillus macauensis ZFHKF-1]|uniref:Stage III sporulation protein AE n=1 Tax=Fictibacillus macauensis ZFHKF-1 TaxID=1196324 RepID=I8UKI1_9BACL|nr:stage III sporulation protein AE [Fictibacillus macauensis]EIT87333.1 stage III sporulation protein AE [Fictibacillus macauensis ZFHKF-1]